MNTHNKTKPSARAEEAAEHNRESLKLPKYRILQYLRVAVILTLTGGAGWITKTVSDRWSSYHNRSPLSSLVSFSHTLKNKLRLAEVCQEEERERLASQIRQQILEEMTDNAEEEIGAIKEESDEDQGTDESIPDGRLSEKAAAFRRLKQLLEDSETDIEDSETRDPLRPAAILQEILYPTFSFEPTEDQDTDNSLDRLIPFAELPSIYQEILGAFDQEKVHLLSSTFIRELSPWEVMIFQAYGLFSPLQIHGNLYSICAAAPNALGISILDPFADLLDPSEDPEIQLKAAKEVLFNLVIFVHEIYGHAFNFTYGYSADFFRTLEKRAPEITPDAEGLNDFCNLYATHIRDEIFAFYQMDRMTEWLLQGEGSRRYPILKKALESEGVLLADNTDRAYDHFEAYKDAKKTGDWSDFKGIVLRNYVLHEGMDYFVNYIDTRLQGTTCGLPLVASLEALLTQEEPH